MMSDVTIKQEMSSHPTKTIVSGNENDSITHQDDETRGDVTVSKRDGDYGDREGFSQQVHKKKPSSPAAQSKSSISGNFQVNQHQQQNTRYYTSNSMPPNIPGPRGMFPPMSRGYGGPPAYNYHGGNFGPPHPHYHNHPGHMMQPYNAAPNVPYPGPPGPIKGGYHPSMPYGGPGPYGIPPQYPPHGMNPNYHNASMNLQSDSNSISSKSSMNSKKKRTIEGVHNPINKMSASYNFRRTDSNSSTTSTVTAGNNASTGTHITDDSLQILCKASPEDEGNKLASGGLYANEHHRVKSHHGEPKHRYHRRDYSAASTASSLSAGGYSLSSYERGMFEKN
jgi:hypothetical protein